MNVYVAVEGEVGEKKVYEKWIPFINPSLVHISRSDDFVNNNFYIVSGGGYPNYFEIIKNAVNDMDDNPSIDRLVIVVDSEDYTYQEKYDEIEGYLLKDLSFAGQYKIIVQHFCLEAWALGNRKIFSNSKLSRLDPDLAMFISTYNVKTNEGL
jgi:hypothetical protein